MKTSLIQFEPNTIRYRLSIVIDQATEKQRINDIENLSHNKPIQFLFSSNTINKYQKKLSNTQQTNTICKQRNKTIRSINNLENSNNLIKSSTPA